MDLLWIGLVVGLFLTCTFLYLQKRKIASATIYITLSYIVLFTITQAFLMYAALEVTSARLAVIFLSRAVTPMTIGIFCGMVLFHFGLRLKGRPSSKLNLVDAGCFGVMFLVIVVIARDPTLSWMNNLTKANIQGVEFDFANNTGTSHIAAPVGSQSSSIVNSGYQTDTVKIEFALKNLTRMTEFIERDHAYFGENPVGSDDTVGEIDRKNSLEYRFYSDVMTPIVSKLMKARQEIPWTESVLDLNIELVENARNIVRYESLYGAIDDRDDNRVHRDSYADLLANFREKLSDKIDDLCHRERQHNKAKYVNNPEFDIRAKGATDFDCYDNAHSPIVKLDEIIADSFSRKELIFKKWHVYGVLTVSLLLLSVHADDAALKDLDEWISTELHCQQDNSR